MRLNKRMEVTRYWRNQEGRYMGEGRPLFKARYEKNEGEEGHRRLILGSKLLNIEMELVQNGKVGDYLKGWAKVMVGVLRGRGFEDNPLKKLGFEVAGVIGKDGGEEFAAAVVKEVEGEEVETIELIDRMREVGMGKSAVVEWLFSVNGYKRGVAEDVDEVKRMVELVYD